jgi:hypothetical protein
MEKLTAFSRNHAMAFGRGAGSFLTARMPPRKSRPLAGLPGHGPWPWLLTSLMIAAAVPFSIFGGWVPYSSSLDSGAQCIVDVSALHPTQFAVGYWEIGERAKKVVKKDGKKLEKYMEEHVGKIVVGPGGEPYIFDRHHMACIMQRTGKSPTIFATVEANFKSLPADSFWKVMVARKWAYLYDNKGMGPLDPSRLPKSIQNLDDDPFRSLAWAVREREGYHASGEPFAEFQWANFFRKKLPFEKANENMELLIREALKICHEPSARTLPGYFAGSGEN